MSAKRGASSELCAAGKTLVPQRTPFKDVITNITMSFMQGCGQMTTDVLSQWISLLLQAQSGFNGAYTSRNTVTVFVYAVHCSQSRLLAHGTVAPENKFTVSFQYADVDRVSPPREDSNPYRVLFVPRDRSLVRASIFETADKNSVIACGLNSSVSVEMLRQVAFSLYLLDNKYRITDETPESLKFSLERSDCNKRFKSEDVDTLPEFLQGISKRRPTFINVIVETIY